MERSLINNLDVPYRESTEIWQFDHNGLVTAVMDEAENMVTAKYMENPTYGQKYKVKHSNDTGKYTNNLLKNSGASNGDLNHWSIKNGYSVAENGVKTTNKTSYLGENCFKVKKTVENPWPMAMQSVFVPISKIDKKYTFSADVKIKESLSGGEGAMLHLASFKGTTQQAGDDYSEHIFETNNDWRRISVTINVPANANEIRCYFGLKESEGTAYFDCLQLEEGEFANDYNMVENSSFDRGFESWTKQGLDESVDIIKDGKLKIVGNHTQEKSIYQNIQVNRKDAVLAIRAQAQGVAVPQSGYYIGCELNFENLNTITNEKPWVYTPFNANVSDIQCVYGSINTREIAKEIEDEFEEENGYRVTLGKLTSVGIQIGFNNNCNTVHFDNIQVCFDDYGVTYDRDPKGNIISTINNIGKDTHTPRDPSNNRPTEIITTNQHIENEYDKPGHPYRLKSSKCLIGENQKVKTKLYYKDENGNDAYGNVTKSTLIDDAETGKFIETESAYTSSGNFLLWSKGTRDNQTDFEYNENNGNLNKLTTPNEVETSYEYDLVGRIKSGTSRDQSAHVLAQTVYSYTNGILNSITSSMVDLTNCVAVMGFKEIFVLRKIALSTTKPLNIKI